MRFMLPCGCLQKDEDDEDQAHLHKPRDNKLYQQKLKPCCLLVITTQKVVTLFVLTGLIFLPIGITLLVQSTEIYQQDFEYTHCYTEGSRKCSNERIGTTCYCDDIKITVPETVKGEIMLLYGLNNYYQNHRLYRQSQSFLQLLGDVEGACYVKEYCDPYNQGLVDEVREVTYYPKGAIANSYFTDTFTIRKATRSKEEVGEEIPLDFTDISWKSDRDSKFLLPANWKGWTPDSGEYVMPKDWNKWADKNTTENKILPIDIRDEHLINWMNPAAFPSFTKLYAKVKLDPGSYTLHVAYRYHVHAFHGEKFVRLAETSWMGGRSYFLGSAYCIVGFFCVVAAAFFIVISRRTRAKRHERKKKIDEQLVHYKDQNNNAQSSTL
ncbi:hypothetical protein ACHWQZ_G003952 [Mnemiopsis leidyi]